MKLVEVRKGDYYDLSGVRCLHIDEADKEIWLTSWKGQYKLPLTFPTLTDAVACLEGLVAKLNSDGGHYVMLSGCNACDACDIRRVYIDEGCFALQVETWHNDNWRYDFLTMTDAQEQLTEIITAIDEAE